MRVLITGHNGYIGSVMVPALRAAGHAVVGLDTCYFAECTLGEEAQNVPVIHKDIRDVTFEDVVGFDAVIHLAALSNDPLGDLKPEWTFDINHAASVRLASLARAAGVSRYVYASSCSMYGASDSKQILTESAPLRPVTPYAESKVRTEAEVAALADDSFSPIFMRNATAYGVSPRFRADIVLNNLVCWAHVTGGVRIMSDGTPWRPLVHVEDIARAFVAVLEAPREAVHNQAFNVGINAENYQVRELAEIVRETVPGSAVEFAGAAAHDPRDYRVDFTKLSRAVPGFTAKWDVRSGAAQLYEAVRGASLTREDLHGRRFLRLPQLRYLLDRGSLDGSLRWSAT